MQLLLLNLSSSRGAPIGVQLLLLQLLWLEVPHVGFTGYVLLPGLLNGSSNQALPSWCYVRVEAVQCVHLLPSPLPKPLSHSLFSCPWMCQWCCLLVQQAAAAPIREPEMPRQLSETVTELVLSYHSFLFRQSNELSEFKSFAFTWNDYHHSIIMMVITPATPGRR